MPPASRWPASSTAWGHCCWRDSGNGRNWGWRGEGWQGLRLGIRLSSGKRARVSLTRLLFQLLDSRLLMLQQLLHLPQCGAHLLHLAGSECFGRPEKNGKNHQRQKASFEHGALSVLNGGERLHHKTGVKIKGESHR